MKESEMEYNKPEPAPPATQEAVEKLLEIYEDCVIVRRLETAGDAR